MRSRWPVSRPATVERIRSDPMEHEMVEPRADEPT